MIKFEGLPIAHELRITSPFGPRGGGFHHGIDLGARIAGLSGDELLAVADGVIITAKADSNDPEARKGYGFYILIRHEGFYTLYGHMTGLIVKTGQQVKAGEVVGHLGNTGNSTGAHLHFEVRTGPAPDTAKDPAPYLIRDKLHDIAALVQKRFNFSDATMDYLTSYKFAPDLLSRLAG